MRVSIDTGGTFTDVLLEVDGQLVIHKCPSTPDDPGRAVVQGIRAALQSAGLDTAPTHVLHGTTVGTNALLEQRGARVFLVTTTGFEDLLELGRQARPHLYALVPVAPEPAISGMHGVLERIRADGSIQTPLHETSLTHLIHALDATQNTIDAIAICLLHAYANPTHERLLEARLQAQFPNLTVTRSSDILPEFREFERCSTTVANAALAPIMRGYLKKLEAAPDIDSLHVMQSSGGLMSAAEAAAYPVHTALSGPAGGVLGGWRAGAAAGFNTLVTFDMGGTSTDVGLCAGSLHLTTQGRIGAYPICVPMVDVHTVGAGGGSIARIDKGGALKVGPESAGSRPGPACYARGGTQPTVSDANLVLGRLLPNAFLGGTMTLDAQAAQNALKTLQRAGMTGTLEDIATGVLDVAIAAMARALKVISVERGHDPRTLALVAFGGAGALHACALAEALGMPAVVVPPAPGLLSAMGILNARVQRAVAQTIMLNAQEPHTPDALQHALAELQRQASALLERDGIPSPQHTFVAEIEARYQGQSFELRLPWTASQELPQLIEAFEHAHERRYGYRMEGRPVELVTLRVRGLGPENPTKIPTLPSRPGSPQERALIGVGPTFFDGQWRETPRFQRDPLAPGDRIHGPAIIAEYSATTVLPPAWTLEVVQSGALVLSLGALV